MQPILATESTRDLLPDGIDRRSSLVAAPDCTKAALLVSEILPEPLNESCSRS